MPRPIAHARIAENALRRNATSIEDLIHPTVPGFKFTVDDPSEGHALFQRWTPQTAEEEDQHMYNLLLDAFKIIYKETSFKDDDGKGSNVFQQCKLWMKDVPAEDMAAMTLWILSPEQKKFILARNRGDPIRREELESLLPVYAGGDSGPLIYILVARPRNVDGENIYKSKLGPNVVRYYVGSANQKGEDTPSGSKRAYEHGDQTERFRDQTNNGPKQFYQYGFGDPATDSSDYEKPCILAFEILTIPASFHGMRAPTLFFEAAICDLTHAYGTDTFKSIRTSARAAEGVSQPVSIVNGNSTAPYAVPRYVPRRQNHRPRQDLEITRQNRSAGVKARFAREFAEHGGRVHVKAHRYGPTGEKARHRVFTLMFKDGYKSAWKKDQMTVTTLFPRFREWDIVDGEQVVRTSCVTMRLDWAWIQHAWGEDHQQPKAGDKIIFTMGRYTTGGGGTDLTLFLETAGKKVDLLQIIREPSLDTSECVAPEAVEMVSCITCDNKGVECSGPSTVPGKRSCNECSGRGRRKTKCVWPATFKPVLPTRDVDKTLRDNVGKYLSKVKLFHGDTEPWKDAVKLEEHYAFLERRSTVGKLTGKEAEKEAKAKKQSRKNREEAKARKDKKLAERQERRVKKTKARAKQVVANDTV